MQPTAVMGTVGSRIGCSVVSLVTGVIAARHLGAVGRSHLAVVLSVAGLFGIMGLLGLDTANLRFASRSTAAFRQLVRWSVRFSLVGGTVLPALWWLAGQWFPVARLGLNPRLALVGVALCPVTAAVALLGTAQIGRGRPVSFGLVNAGTAVVYLAGVLALALAGKITVTGCAVSYGAGQLAGVIALLAMALWRSRPEGDTVRIREYRAYAFRAYLPNVAQYGMLRMDVPIIQLLTGTTAVALYAIALPIAEGLMLLPIAVATIMFPRVTAGTVRRVQSVRVAWAVFAGTLVAAAALGVVAPVFVPWAYGSVFRGSVGVIWCMLPGLVIFSAGRVAQTYLSATDRLRQVTVASAAGVIAGVAALAVLAPRFGADGAGAADSVGYLGYTAFMLWGLRAPRGDSRFSLGLRGPRSLRSGRRRITSAATPTAPPREAAGAPTAVKSGAAALARASRAALARVAGVTTAVTTAVAVGVISTEGTKLMVLAAGLIVAAVVVLIPEAGLYVLAVLIPVSQTSGGASLITVKDLLVLIVACLAGQVIAGRMVRPRAGAVALGLALVGYFMLSAALSGGPDGNGVHNLIDALTLGLTLLCLPLIISDNAASRRALMVFAFTAAATSIAEIPVAQASLVQSGGNTAIAAGQTGALNHNAEGALFVLALGVLLARLPQTQGKVARLAVGAGTALITAGIAFSFSRSSYFGAIAVIVLFALRRSIRGLIGLAAVALCIIPLVPASVLARINTVWSSNGLDPSSASRLDLWTSAIRMFTVHPVFGVGYLNFSASLPSYFVDTGNYPISDILFYQLDFAHNTYLSVLAETGIIGALLVGALIVTGWHRAWLASRAGDWAGESALLGLVGVGVCSIFGEPLFVPAVFAGLLFVVLVTQKTGKVSRDGILHHLAISRPRPPAAHYASRGHAHRRRLVL